MNMKKNCTKFNSRTQERPQGKLHNSKDREEAQGEALQDRRGQGLSEEDVSWPGNGTQN